MRKQWQVDIVHTDVGLEEKLTALSAAGWEIFAVTESERAFTIVSFMWVEVEP